jgi:GTP-binding protein HflX
MFETKRHEIERVMLVGVERPGHDRWLTEDSLKELSELALSAGGEVVDVVRQHLKKPTAPYFIGSGKAEELAQVCRRKRVDTVIFDEDLSPAQARNLEEVFKLKILDRTELILDIFAQRARTREGKLQIELAQLQYLLPRLTHLWGHLSRQRGGIGTRGPGEQQLEVDRRRIGTRIEKLKREIEEVRKQRSVQRSGRRRHEWPLVSIVGYTNAGKSTLLNALTGSKVVAEDKLFATLDPTTRRLRLPDGQNVLLTDTVGFLRKLPHHLVDSFFATLEEVVEADLLLHVVDVSHPAAKEQINAVEDVLKHLRAWDKPIVTALNKVDRVEQDGIVTQLQCAIPRSVPISATEKSGLDELMRQIGMALTQNRALVTLRVPLAEMGVVPKIQSGGQIISQQFEDGIALIEARVNPRLLGELKQYIIARHQ